MKLKLIVSLPQIYGKVRNSCMLGKVLPFVSIVMPVRNEARFIAGLLNNLLAQAYPIDLIEIIVADGMSDDGTREILEDYAARIPRVRVVDNPERIVSTGLNLAIRASRGDVICRIDGHCEVATDFVAQNIQLLDEHPEAWVVGGPIVHKGGSWMGEAAAEAMAHPMGVGLATHRFADYEGYVEGAQFPTFRRFVFDKIGLFDENLVRNQDDELNFRIAQAGGKIYVSPRVRYVYFVRDRLGKLFRQYFQYSFWRIPVIRKHRKPTTPRQMVPSLFFAVVIFMGVIGLWLHNPIIVLALPGIYLSVLLSVAVSIVPRKGLAVASLVPVAMITMHCAYALGMAYGAWAALFHRHAWDRHGKMSIPTR